MTLPPENLPIVSIIVPVLNERHELPRMTQSLRVAASYLPPSWGEVEILFVDGGSTDGTGEWLSAQPDCRWMVAHRGRGLQLRAGVEGSRGAVLFLLHADVQVPPAALASVLQNMARPGVAGGCFSVDFGARAWPSLRAVAHLINLRSRALNTATGDQGIFCSRSAYQRAGGVPPWPLFEDVELTKRLKQQGIFLNLRPKLTISPRKWLKFGVARTTAMMCLLMVGYYLGVAPEKLSLWFKDVRPSSPQAG